MLRVFFLSILLAATPTWAQSALGTDLRQLGVTYQFDKFLDVLLNDDTAASYARGSRATIIAPLNLPLDRYVPRLRPAPFTQADVATALGNVGDKQPLSDLLAYSVLNGYYPSTALPKGWSFPPSFLDDLGQLTAAKPGFFF